MNWLTGTSWFLRGLRGQSVTFAALFALGILGLSVIRVLRHALSALHAPWYLWLLLPVVLISWLARQEKHWLPGEQERRRWSRGLIFGAIGISVLLGLLAPKPHAEENVQNQMDRHSQKWNGPPGK